MTQYVNPVSRIRVLDFVGPPSTPTDEHMYVISKPCDVQVSMDQMIKGKIKSILKIMVCFCPKISLNEKLTCFTAEPEVYRTDLSLG